MKKAPITVKEKLKVIVWGIGTEYNLIYKIIKTAEENSLIDIVSLCCRKEDIVDSKFDGYNLIDKNQLIDLNFDCLIIANEGSYKEIEIDAYEILNQKYLKYNNKFQIISYKLLLKPEFNFKAISHFSNLIGNEIDKLNSLMPNPQLTFIFDAVEHCNLNCKGCSNFCPISEKSFVDMDELDNDFSRLNELTENGHLVNTVNISGGEPTLHPKIIDIIKLTRKKFPFSKILLATNGIKLQSISDEFYNECNKNNITVEITKYPVKIDHKKIQDRLEKFCVKYFYRNETKSLAKHPYDFTGSLNAKAMFSMCYFANRCIYLKHGKMFTCQVRACAHVLNKKINNLMYLSEHDGISIYDCSSFEELMSFFTRPIQFCRYCHVNHRRDTKSFEISKKDIKEWS